jgi:ABC-2 type transport system permease protein
MNKSRLFLLVKVQILSYFGINKAVHSKDPSERPRLIRRAVLGVVVLGYLCWASYTYSRTIADVMTAAGGPLSAVPAAMFMAASLLMLITGIYQGGKTLFVYKDYDQLISMPVSVASVAASRIFLLYTYDLLFSVLLIAPAGVVYALLVHPAPLFYPVFIILMILAPVIPLIISAIIGTAVTAFSSRIKKFGTAVNIILSIAVVGVFVFLPMTMDMDAAALGSTIETLMDLINSKYPPTAMFVSAIADLNMLSFASFIVISVLFFVIFSLAISSWYRQICSRVKSSGVIKKANLGEIRQSGQLAALYKRELRRYFSSSIYVMNTSIGLILGIIACAVILFGGGLSGLIGPEAGLYGVDDMIRNISPAIIAGLVCMSTTTGSSISLEGSGIWIIKSMPVSAMTAIWSKIMVNLSLTLPATLICGVMLAIALKLNVAELILVLLIPAVFAVFAAVFGIYVNLKMPRLYWQNEAEVVKQSMASMISMFGPAIIPVAVIILSTSIAGAGKGIVMYSALIPIVLTIIFLNYLHKNSDRLFKKL